MLFQSTSSDPDPGGSIVRYEWFYGDGSDGGPDTIPYTNHVFRTVGAFVVTHRVTDNNGGQAACSATITVNP